MSFLELRSVSKHFGGLAVLPGITLSVKPGERHAVIGPNGAGKTTLFNLITGELMPDSGQIYFRHKEITRLPNHARARMRMARTFQRNRLFPGLSVFQNVRLALLVPCGIHSRLFTPVERFEAVSDRASRVLETVGLRERANSPVASLSYGEQRQLEIALALAADPEVLLLDEPAAGMSPAETAQVLNVIMQIPRTVTLLLIEHDLDFVFQVADRITVMHYGQLIASGTPDEIRASDKVRETYLGQEGATG